ncbi:MAG: ABC transporter substrate-binding protein, partial [Anaerolineae bacterium]
MKSSMWKLFAVLVVLVMALSSLAACGPTTAPEEPAEPAEATEAPVAEATAAPEEPEPTEPPPAERKVATFIWTQEPDNLNPMYTSMWFSTITQQIWNCDPWIWDENNEPQSVLLAEMPSLDNGGISEDGTTITLNLRDDIVWSDGEPITSADFVFTWEMYTNPANTVASTYPYDLLAAMEAPDERTVVMSFDEPFVPWMAAF